MIQGLNNELKSFITLVVRDYDRLWSLEHFVVVKFHKDSLFWISLFKDFQEENLLVKIFSCQSLETLAHNWNNFDFLRYLGTTIERRCFGVRGTCQIRGGAPNRQKYFTKIQNKMLNRQLMFMLKSIYYKS